MFSKNDFGSLDILEENQSKQMLQKQIEQSPPFALYPNTRRTWFSGPLDSHSLVK